MSRLFMNKANRDQAYREIPKAERVNYRRSSCRNQLIHPMYIEDYEKETGRTLTDSDKGFGNTIYRTHFSVLYEITKKWY